MSNLSEIAEMAQWVKQNRHLLETARWVEQNFYLPEAVETARLVAELQASTSREADTLTRYLADQTFLQSAAESMRTPWLDVQDPLRSMGGFAALQSIGHALKDMPAYGHTLGAALRVNLEDWRDRITWPREIFTDYEARADFYVRRGFNPALTNFPAPAFEESLHIATCGGNRLLWLIYMDRRYPPLTMAKRKQVGGAPTGRMTGFFAWKHRCAVSLMSK